MGLFDVVEFVWDLLGALANWRIILVFVLAVGLGVGAAYLGFDDWVCWTIFGVVLVVGGRWAWKAS